MLNEVWKDVIGFEGLYQISNMGNLRSFHVVPITGRIMKPATDRRGYKYQGLSNRIEINNYRIHRLVALAFLDNPLNKPQVNHINGIKTDNRAVNLEWATSTENHKHAVKTGLRTFEHIRGELASSSKLKESDVISIRYLFSKNPCVPTKNELAYKYGVTYQCIHSIVNRISWRHI